MFAHFEEQRTFAIQANELYCPSLSLSLGGELSRWLIFTLTKEIHRREVAWDGCLSRHDRASTDQLMCRLHCKLYWIARGHHEKSKITTAKKRFQKILELRRHELETGQDISQFEEDMSHIDYETPRQKKKHMAEENQLKLGMCIGRAGTRPKVGIQNMNRMSSWNTSTMDICARNHTILSKIISWVKLSVWRNFRHQAESLTVSPKILVI